MSFLGCVTLVMLILFPVSETRSQFDAAEPKRLLLVVPDTIYVVDLETSINLTLTPIAPGLNATTAIDYYHEKKTMLGWTTARPDSIYKLDMVTQNYSAFVTTHMQEIYGIAVDWIQGNVYWTDAVTKTINVVTFDGRLRKTLIGSDLHEPMHIVLNPLEGWMFWSDWGDSPKIKRSGMDGTHRSTVASNGIAATFGLAIDPDSKKIYWTDSETNGLYSSDYDGSNAKLILNLDPWGLRFGLDLFEDSVYWTEYSGVKKADKLTGENEQTIVRHVDFYSAVRILHSSKQPKGENYCEKNAECSHLCLLSPATSGNSRNFTCACPDGMSLIDDQKSCIEDAGIFTYFDTTTSKDAPSAMIVEDEIRTTSKMQESFL